MPEITMFDIGISSTGIEGFMFYTRLIPIQDVYISSGVSFAFQAEVKERLLDDISFLRLKKRRKLSSADLFILTYKKSKIYGVETEIKDARDI